MEIFEIFKKSFNNNIEITSLKQAEILQSKFCDLRCELFNKIELIPFFRG